jgi:hypothetical protein
MDEVYFRMALPFLIVALCLELLDEVRRRAALKTVHLLKGEEHQNRYVLKITPDLNAESKPFKIAAWDRRETNLTFLEFP